MFGGICKLHSATFTAAQSESVQLLPDELRNEESRTHGLRTDELLADEPDQHACCVVHGNVSLGPTRRLCAH